MVSIVPGSLIVISCGELAGNSENPENSDYAVSRPSQVQETKNPCKHRLQGRGKCDPQVLALLRFEVQEPPAVIPLQLDLTPSQWDLWVGIERSNVGPSTC